VQQQLNAATSAEEVEELKSLLFTQFLK